MKLATLSPFSRILHVRASEVLYICTSVPIPMFDFAYLKNLITQTRTILMRQAVLQRIKGNVVIVGDLHGNLHDLIRILSINGFPPQTQYLFLGDYVDRGEFSLPVITLLFVLKCVYPKQITLLRGNHEFRAINKSYGFRAEIERHYGSSELWEEFNSCFQYLPLAAVVNEHYFCVHGGISERVQNISQISSYRFPISDELDDFVLDLVWSDPTDSTELFAESPRGSGSLFGAEATKKFLADNKMKMLIRGHECVDGIHFDHDNSVLTVFSASNYGGIIKNQCGIAFLYANKTHIVRTFPYLQTLKSINALFGDSDGIKPPEAKKSLLVDTSHLATPVKEDKKVNASESLEHISMKHRSPTEIVFNIKKTAFSPDFSKTKQVVKVVPHPMQAKRIKSSSTIARKQNFTIK